MEFRRLEACLERREGGDEDGAVVIAAQGMGIDLERMDMSAYRDNPVLLFGHDGMRPIGRATNGPTWRNNRWEMGFVFARDDADADRVRNLWRQDVIRSASIGYNIHSDGRTQLREVSLVTVPMDEMALKLRQMDTRLDSMEASMAEIAGSVEDSEESIDDAEMAVDPTVVAPVDADGNIVDSEAGESPHTSEPDYVDVDIDLDIDDDDDGDPDGERAAEVERRVAREVDLRVRYASLVPRGFGDSPHSLREFLVAAAGGEVPDASSRSDDYLEGALDMICRRRAGGMRPSGAVSRGSAPVAAPLDFGDLLERKRALAHRRRSGAEMALTEEAPNG